jgi:glutamine cyclotransferase
MKKHNSFLIILLSCTSLLCCCSKKNTENLFSINDAAFKATYTFDESVSIAIVNKENKTIDSIVYSVNDIKLTSKKGLEPVNLELKNQKLGYQNIKALVYFEGGENPADIRNRIELVSNVQPKLLKYKIVNTYEHDTTSFTEGLEFYNDTLYESTGLRGKSFLLKTDYKTGRILKKLKLADQYFGEGITIINDKIFQITYEEKTGFIYDAKTWKLEKTFTYDKDIEGWGMTNDGTFIYQTDKTEKIWKMNPKTQKMIDYVNVYSGTSKIPSINELEWVVGKIYSNIWLKDAVAVINPKNGVVEAILNFADLRKKTTAKPEDALNGIAYNPKSKTIFITGKNWNKMFEIKVIE